MAEAAGIRVVRCPQCDKLLPELPYYSVYVCGGCGATLQAKKNAALECSSATKDEENVKYLEVVDDALRRRRTVNFCKAGADATARSADRMKEDDALSSKVEVLQSIPEQSESDANEKRAENEGFQEYAAAWFFDRVDRRMQEQVSKTGIGTSFGRDELMHRRVHDASVAKHKETPKATERLIQSQSQAVHHAKPPHLHGDCQHGKGRQVDGAARIGVLEKDRAVLLQMLDELRDHVQQHSADGTQLRSTSTPVRRVADKLTAHATRDRRTSHCCSLMSMNGSNAVVPERYSSILVHDMHGCREHAMHGRCPPCHPGHSHLSLDNAFYGPCDPDPFISYHHEGFYHQPAGSCMHCHNSELHLQQAPRALDFRKVPCRADDNPLYPFSGPAVVACQGQNLRVATSSYRSRQFNAPSRKRDHMCEPIAGASPFTVCYNCYELLQLPKEYLANRNEAEVRCGSCSYANPVCMNRSSFSVLPFISHVSSESKGCSDLSQKTQPFHPIDVREACGNALDSSSPSSMSAADESPNTVPPEAELSCRMQSLPLGEQMALSDKNTDDGFGTGSRSTLSEQEKAVLLTESCIQNSPRDVPEVTQRGLPRDDLPRYKFNAEKDEHCHMNTKGGNSFLGSLIKKSFRSHNSMSGGRARVLINGYPIAYRAVRKAEKLAGPISPGQYWYDYRAGFWGVIGHPCLGMIPPFIPEFNYPMPKNCSGGNSGVLVNGRELHKKDLDLLAGRGLPETVGQSYRIEISGRVWDESSGEELPSLGRLAPTVEKMRRGFGMQVPSTPEW